MVTELELEPIGGDLVPYGYKWGEEQPYEEPVRQYTGGVWGEPGWLPPDESSLEPQWIEGEWEDVTPPTSGLSEEMRRKLEEKAAKIMRSEEELEDLKRKTALEEYKSKRRQFKREHRRAPGKWIQKYLKPRPQMDLAKIFFPGRALRETYIPHAPVKTTLEQIKGIRDISAPQIGMDSTIGQSVMTSSRSLRRASSPPPLQSIKAPSTKPAETEGLGAALVRLRRMGEFKKVDQAVLEEVHANGDIDTPTHVKSKVSKLGFSPKEVDASLSRLRNLGLLLPTGRVHNGEKELMLSGGSHG